MKTDLAYRRLSSIIVLLKCTFSLDVNGRYCHPVVWTIPKEWKFIDDFLVIQFDYGLDTYIQSRLQVRCI